MGRINKAVTAVLIGSIVILAVVVAYAVMNNKNKKERTKYVTQQNAKYEDNITNDSSYEIEPEESLHEESKSEHLDEQISLHSIQALAGSKDIDCKTDEMELVSYSEKTGDNRMGTGIIVTKDTFGSDDSIFIVLIGYDVSDIEDGSFSDLKNLKEIRVDTRNPYYASVEGCLYNKKLTQLICIPQNTKSVQVIGSIEGYTPHAVDGLSQDRIDKLNSILNGSHHSVEGERRDNDGIASVGEVSDKFDSVTDQQDDERNDLIGSDVSEDPPMIIVNDNDSYDDTHKEEEAVFSQYVYTDDKGRTAFKYTGSGDSAIYIPDGVEVVAGFCSDPFAFNYDVTYVHLPSTIKKFLMADFYNTEAGGYDTNYYNYLYQCPNLKTVEGGGKIDYMCDGDSVTRRGGIVIWSNNSKVPYDAQAYIDYNNR